LLLFFATILFCGYNSGKILILLQKTMLEKVVLFIYEKPYFLFANCEMHNKMSNYFNNCLSK